MLLHWVDIVVVAVYFVLVLGIGLFFIKRGKDSKEFFLAGNDSTWFAIGCSLFASNIGSEHFIGLAGSGSKDGMCVSFGEWPSAFMLLLLCWLFLPFYIKTKIFTLPEFLERRYGKACRMLLTLASIILYVLTKISVALYAGAIVLKYVLQWDTLVSVIVIVVATGIYTVAGGLKAVIYTEVLQTGILIIGGVSVVAFGMHAVGGWSGLKNNYKDQLSEDMFHLFQPATHPHFPWTGVIFGMPFTAMWYWCTDQVIVQRALSGKSLDHSQGGCILGSFFKVLPVFLMVMPGIIARALIPEVSTNPNSAFVALSVKELPRGFLGLMVAAMLAALMSSLASVFHSVSTLFTMDIYREFKYTFTERFSASRIKKAGTEETLESQQGPSGSSPVARATISERELVLVGRIAAAIVVFIGIAWIPLVRILSGQMYVYTHKVMSYIAPPIAVVFIVGVLFPRANKTGAITTLIVGFTIGLTRLFSEVIFLTVLSAEQQSAYGRNIFVRIFIKSNFLNFSACYGWLCIILFVVVSLLTKRPDPDVVANLTIDVKSLIRPKAKQQHQQFTDEEEMATKQQQHYVQIVQGQPSNDITTVSPATSEPDVAETLAVTPTSEADAVQVHEKERNTQPTTLITVPLGKGNTLRIEPKWLNAAFSVLSVTTICSLIIYYR